MVGLLAPVVFRLEGGLAVLVLAVLWGVGCVVGLLALVVFRRIFWCDILFQSTVFFFFMLVRVIFSADLQKTMINLQL